MLVMLVMFGMLLEDDFENFKDDVWDVFFDDVRCAIHELVGLEGINK